MEILQILLHNLSLSDPANFPSSHITTTYYFLSNEWLVGLVSVLRFAIKILIHYNFSFERVGICH